jgi:alcohol dehydrogenase
MEAPAGEFNYTRLEKVIFGPGTIKAIARELDKRGLKRAVIVTGKSLGASKLLDRVTGALGERCAAVYKGVAQHVPAPGVRALVAEMKRVNADCLISFGGGSPIDAAKVAAESILTDSDATKAAEGLAFDKAHARADTSRDLIHIAVPTTLSAGEYTPVGGVTDENTLVKNGVVDPRLQPRVIINDPELTVETPEWLWVATGMRSLDHAVEAIYSIRHQMIADTLAAKAIKLLFEHLPASIKTKGAESLAHRGHCQTAAWFSIFGGMNTRFGISHALGHQIGPKWDVPHGVTSCITMPHVMRFMADLAPQRFGPIADGLGVKFSEGNARAAALECADRVAQFIAQFDVPHSLKAAGVSEGDLGQIAEPVWNEVEHSKVVDRPVNREEIVSLLQSAYN